jgi:hypothetical protein
MDMDEVRTWMVKPKSGYCYKTDPRNPKRCKYVMDDGTEFQATRKEAWPQRHKLIDVTPSQGSAKDRMPKRRGRKPKVTTEVSEPMAERTMNQDSLFESG